MRRTMTGLFAAALALGLFIAAPGFAHHPGDHPQGKHGADHTVVEECDGGTVTYDGPEWMWPPNHKYRPLTVTAEADDSNDNAELATQGTHDEYIGGDPNDEMNGAGNTADDIDPPADADAGMGSAETEHQVRAERSGRGVGRTYTITYEAQFGSGEPCIGDFKITVPHSMGNSANVKKNHNPNHEE